MLADARGSDKDALADEIIEEVAGSKCQQSKRFQLGDSLRTSLLRLSPYSCSVRYTLSQSGSYLGYLCGSTWPKPIVDPRLYFTINCGGNWFCATIMSIKAWSGIVIIPRDKLSLNGSINFVALLIACLGMLLKMLKMTTAPSSRALTFFLDCRSAWSVCCKLLQLKRS